MINHSMDKNKYSLPFRIPGFLGIFFLFCGLALHGLDTKRFDAPPPKRPTYLSFAKPTPLRFSISPQPVDRFNITPPAAQPIVQVSVVSQVSADGAQTASLPFHPCRLQYDQNSSSTPAFLVSAEESSFSSTIGASPVCHCPILFRIWMLLGPIRPMSYCGF